jgi:phosphate acyltransferase
MRIALDALGTDARPEPDVAGAVLAASEYKDTIILVGDENRIHTEIAKHNTSGLTLEIVPAEQEIHMDEKPSEVLKTKTGSSMHVGMDLIKSGQADAFVTMGNTGAAQAIATLSTLRRISGVKRPALSTIYPVAGRQMIFLDVGANADSRAEWLLQFGIMGSIYAETALGLKNPRVATLSNGEEEGKGNQLVRDAQNHLNAASLNYVGHIEPIEITQNRADVVVMDGFMGNIFLKTFEGSVSYFTGLLREEIKSNWTAKLGALLMRGVFGRVRQYFDTDAIGGAPLLGVNGVVIIGHGSSSARAVKNAINQARQAVAGDTVAAIRQGLAQQQDPTPIDAMTQSQ